MPCWHLPRETSCSLSFANVVFLSHLNKFDIEMIAWIWPIQGYRFIGELKMWRSHVIWKKCVNDLTSQTSSLKSDRHPFGLIYSVLPNDLILLCPFNRCNFVTDMFPIPCRWFLYRFSHMETFKRSDIRKHGFGVYIIKIRREDSQSCTKVLPLLHIRTYKKAFVMLSWQNIIRELKFIYL